MIRVLVADDQAMVRTGFGMILGAESDIEVVAEARDGVEAVAEARRTKPDVALMDIRMPRMDGLEALKQIANDVNVVVCTTFDHDEYVHTALKNGACGFLLKDAGPNLLIEAVRAAVTGDALISPSITVRLLQHMNSPAQQQPHTLSARELDVVKLAAIGRTNAEIAQELFISIGTVKTHLASVQTKLDARNRVEIAAWAWESRLVGQK
ncbi:DNA-binding response regulator, NarL/FixJ family, contains REC and HTH domains [Lentzea albidocapillata subsp. violacea]|uniref:DNA-binding response regulator, NarL/FixJ family, contains REC and HTH domains n=1 Tax=Lentzea albidocapillata subsp. violacea TaxID=128104 RepID=A0A1G9SGR2_9PSEU|nr:response regulator transcription factor [Lentzea albidocapillata]SDM34592.1 DNA-binding response regulator, NarL/FixJ family, contains REC and HTH domains [Lentzea albidocapillata subsp. violacea]